VANKSKCPITRSQFRQHAKPLDMTIDGKAVTAEPKEFSTGSLGWNVNQKLTVTIDGVRVECQLGLNLTAVGSKELPADEANPAA
jgi:hypothetical protein